MIPVLGTPCSRATICANRLAHGVRGPDQRGVEPRQISGYRIHKPELGLLNTENSAGSLCPRD